ncbi:MAG: bifunctional UDP-sugar hydrolase/5'-nucleotidase [Kofleriaceae bacterium]|nr:bifunctional UDP-sugar hydrolase/5'-nucleotidase [Kofleriaceae bacterium]
MKRVTLVVAMLVFACSAPPQKPERGPRPAPQRATGARTISVIGTNDLHGALERLPLLAGYLANLREVRTADGGGVVLLDGGDMFQGTLESNLGEGIDVVRAYNALGYTAAAVGNHEFDFGPAGPAATPATVEDDPRGALKARAAEAKFPFLVSNIIDKSSGNRIAWPNMPASTIVEVSGVKIGLIGASTEATPFTTMPANFVGLQMLAPAQAITLEARGLRDKGAQVVIVTAHIGTKCAHLEQPNDPSSCEKNEELYKLITELPNNTVDVIVAGHTHAAVAHRISDIAVIESYSSGRAFGRVDLRIAADGHVTSTKIHKPQMLCEGENLDGNPVPVGMCRTNSYEGKPVRPVAEIEQIVALPIQTAAKRRNEKLGVSATAVIEKGYEVESSQGNWITDLMLAASPGAQIALTNGGGLRADIPAGELTYGALYEAMPFDNRFAIVELKGANVRSMVSSNLQRGGAILSWSGIVAKARCKSGKLDLAITLGGKPLDDNATYKLVTSDFLASSDKGVIGRLKLPANAIKLTDKVIREELANLLRKAKGTPRATVEPSKLLSATLRRMDYEGTRPVSCSGKPAAPSVQEGPE